MKDTDRVELTVGDIKRGAEKCGTAKEILKELFPEVFRESPPVWEDVTLKMKLYPDNGLFFIQDEWGNLPFKTAEVLPWDKSTVKDQYELRDGIIWRKKSA